jgi:hypothetical protein
MRPRIFSLVLAALWAPWSLAEGLLLVSDDEVAREASYAATVDERFVPRSVPMPGAPLIQVRSPSIVEELKAPFPIRVEFKALEGAQVLPATFKVYYGLLKLDITDRVVRKVRVEPGGVAIEEADIPSGSHKLLLQIKDSKGRLGETALSFRVAPSL